MFIKKARHIEIVRSSKTWLSSMSQESCDAIYDTLSAHYREVGVTVVDTVEDLEALAFKRPDLVFLGMKFVPNDPILGPQDPAGVWITSFLDDCGIAYTGSTQTAHEYDADKTLAKQSVHAAGLATSAHHVVRQNELLKQSDITLPYPLFVKPTNRGGGLGVDPQSVINNFDELKAKVGSLATDFGADSLIERYLTGREFSVAILKDRLSSELLAMPLELIAPAGRNGIRILSDQVKSANAEQAIGVTDQAISHSVKGLALEVFKVLGARDYGRIDIRLDDHGTPTFLEANLLPSLISGYGSFPKACVINQGLGYEDMILAISELGLSRNTIPDAAVLFREPTPEPV